MTISTNGTPADQRHRREVLGRIVRQRLVHRRADRHRAAARHAERVAVGRGLGASRGADASSRRRRDSRSPPACPAVPPALAATMRASVSTAPPGAHGTINVTGRCRIVLRQRRMLTQCDRTPATTAAQRMNDIMTSPLVLLPFADHESADVCCFLPIPDSNSNVSRPAFAIASARCRPPRPPCPSGRFPISRTPASRRPTACPSARRLSFASCSLTSGSREQRLQLLVQPFDHRRGRLRRRHHHEPRHRLVAGHAGLGDGRDVGKRRERAPWSRRRARAPCRPGSCRPTAARRRT